MSTEILTQNIGEMIVAVGALGTAAYGIVDGFKFLPRWAASGFGVIRRTLGGAIYGSLGGAYGIGFNTFLRAQYISGRSKGEVAQSLRQGVRVGLSPENAPHMAAALGTIVDPVVLTRIAGKIHDGKDLEPQEQTVLSRFELALDTRIDAALALAENRYVATMQMGASAVAVGLAVLARYLMETTNGGDGTMNAGDWIIALVAGIIAVPIAPIAKDIASGLQAAAKAVGRR